MKALCFAILFFFCLPSASSQESLGDWPSLSLHAGGFVTAQKYFANAYGSKSGIAYGGAAEFPVIDHLRLIGRLSYFFKSAPGYEWRQWITYAGAKYEFGLTDGFFAAVSGGMALTIYLDTQPEVTAIGRTTGNMIPGFFAGVGVEHPFASVPLTVFAEAHYSYMSWNFPGYTYNYGGTEFTAGIRYHFVRHAETGSD